VVRNVSGIRSSPAFDSPEEPFRSSPTVSPRAQNRQDEEFGESRLIDCLRSAAGRTSADLIDPS